MPSIICVPPSASSSDRYFRAAATFSTVAGTGARPNREARSEKRMIWKVSVGSSRSRALATASFACSSGRPSIDPEQSTTNTISIGRRATAAVSSGGISISVKNPSPVSASVCVNRFDLMVSPATRKSSTKSRLGIVVPCASVTPAVPGRSRAVVISWLDRISSMFTPASMRTRMPMSWPDRSSGARYSTAVPSGASVRPPRGTAPTGSAWPGGL